MEMNSITGDVVAFKLPSLNAAVSLTQSAKGSPSAGSPSSSQSVHSNIADLNADNKVSATNKQAPVVSNESTHKTVRAMSHIVESYNPQGKVRIKFMDSNNNVIYQIPSEMVAKTEDLMAKPETATNIKG